jgi:hypothetical protein
MKLDNTVYVVCDANGICRGIFLDEALANRVADIYAAYVSVHNKIKLNAGK